jgi:hypothetical protein
MPQKAVPMKKLQRVNSITQKVTTAGDYTLQLPSRQGQT